MISERARAWAALALLACAPVCVVAAARADAPIMTTVRPLEIESPLVNPDQGWGIWAGPRYFTGKSMSLEENTSAFEDGAPLFSWVLVDWMWADLEPREGQFDWKGLDAVLDYWSRRGKQIYLRVWVTDDPGWDGSPGNVVVPEWVWAAGAKFHAYTGEGHSHKREPDYAGPTYESVFVPKMSGFLRALAARYDGEGGAVTNWGVMGFGNWGEWHTLWSHYPWPNRDVKRSMLTRIIQLYAGIFHKQLITAFCPDSDGRDVHTLDEFLYRQALDEAVASGFGIARHGFIDGLVNVDHLAMEKYWRQTPVFAEGNWSYHDLKSQRSHGTFEENLEVMAEWHANWAHFYTDAASYHMQLATDRTVLEKGLAPGGLGCRLVPTEASWPAQLPAGHLLLMRSRWINRNAGRCFKRYPLYLYLTDASGVVQFSAPDRTYNETDWVQGEPYDVTSIVAVPKGLAVGDYDIRIALTDSQGKPIIRLGIAGVDGQLRYPLGRIHIAAPDVP